MRCGEITRLSRLRFMVPGLIVEDTIGCFYGPSQSFKSFLMLDLALSLACGERWCGEQLAQRPVAYIAAEGAAGMGVRVDAWLRDRGREGQDPPFLLIPEAVDLTDAACMRDLQRDLEAEARGLGARFGLTVFDTLSTCSAGTEEDSGNETALALAGMTHLRRALGCTSLTVHHTGKDEDRGMRGSYALKGNFDTVVKVERGQGIMHYSTWVEKQKDGRNELARHSTAAPVEWERDGEAIDTLVIRPRDAKERLSAQFDEQARTRTEIASLLELDQPTGRATICAKLGWSRGRAYAKIDEAVPPGAGGAAEHPHLRRVRLTRDHEGRVVMGRSSR